MMLRTTLAVALLAGTAFSALAADLPSKSAAALPVFVAEPSPWMVRVRALGVIPDASAILEGQWGCAAWRQHRHLQHHRA